MMLRQPAYVLCVILVFLYRNIVLMYSSIKEKYVNTHTTVDMTCVEVKVSV